MGWSGGTGICVGIWKEVRKYVPEKERVKVLAKVIKILEQHDWDCEDEIENCWPEALKALKKAIPGYGED